MTTLIRVSRGQTRKKRGKVGGKGEGFFLLFLAFRGGKGLATRDYTLIEL